MDRKIFKVSDSTKLRQNNSEWEIDDLPKKLNIPRESFLGRNNFTTICKKNSLKRIEKKDSKLNFAQAGKLMI